MKRTTKITSLITALLLIVTLMGCSSAKEEPASAQTTAVSQEEVTETSAEETVNVTQNSDLDITVYAMNGPTGMGMAYLNKQSDTGNTAYKYDIHYASAPDEISGSIISGEIDIAAVPINLASVLYNKTEGNVLVCAANTLGVLHLITNGTEVQSMKDLAGKTIETSGQGSTPEYIINYLLEKNDLAGQVQLEYVSEHAQALTDMSAGKTDIIMVPEPFATNALSKVESASRSLDLTEEWDKVCGTSLVQGVLVVQKSFAEEHADILDTFLAEYAASVDFTNESPAEAAAIIADYGIVAAAPLAEKAIPNCNIVCITGEEMQSDISGMLSVLENADPKSVGGKVPAEDFYYIGK